MTWVNPLIITSKTSRRASRKSSVCLKSQSVRSTASLTSSTATCRSISNWLSQHEWPWYLARIQLVESNGWTSAHKGFTRTESRRSKIAACSTLKTWATTLIRWVASGQTRRRETNIRRPSSWLSQEKRRGTITRANLNRSNHRWRQTQKYLPSQNDA